MKTKKTIDSLMPMLYNDRHPGVVEKYNSAFGTQRRGGSTFHSDYKTLTL
jgi:hypothetical protein